MKHYMGLSDFYFRQKQQEIPVYYEPSKLINAHLLICGMSGVGKSFQAIKFLSSAARAGLEIDVFDAHDELDNIPGATAAVFSQATNYGYNPLVLDTDIHTGGVDRQIEFFIKLLKDLTPQFGVKQEGALRSLLLDTYAACWIRQNDRRSWHREKITEKRREEIINAKQWAELKKYYPTLEDLKSYAKRKILALTIGGDNQCITSFEQLTRLKTRLNGLNKKFAKAVDDEEHEKIAKQIEETEQKCIDAYSKFVKNMETGKEIDDILKYDSVQVLTSVLQRINLLSASGILSANEPPFGNSRVRVHQIKSISHEQQVLYVKLRLQSIFDECKRLGPVPQGQVRRIAFLDEAHKYFNNEQDDIINIISKEARKFGLGLWCASQQPTAFPESFLTNVGATVMLGIHTSYWKRAASMFRISEDSLKFIKPKEVMAVKMLIDGKVDPPFGNIIVPNPNTAIGQKAANFR